MLFNRKPRKEREPDDDDQPSIEVMGLDGMPPEIAEVLVAELQKRLANGQMGTPSARLGDVVKRQGKNTTLADLIKRHDGHVAELKAQDMGVVFAKLIGSDNPPTENRGDVYTSGFAITMMDPTNKNVQEAAIDQLPLKLTLGYIVGGEREQGGTAVFSIEEGKEIVNSLGLAISLAEAQLHATKEIA